MAKGTTTAADIIKKVLQGVALPWDAITTVYLSLHTADPAGTSQATSEATYTSYARVAVTRDAAGWDVTGAVASNDDLLQFPQCTGGSSTVTHVGIGTASSGTGQLLYVGPLNSPLPVSNLIQPQFNANSLTVTET